MKRILLITLVITIASTFALTAIQAPAFDAVGAVGVVCPNVSWNTKACSAPPESVQPATAWSYPPVYTPTVGWNT